MSKYTVEAQYAHDVSRWVLQAVEAPGAISEVNRLTQAVEYMREAISFVTEEPEDQIEIELVPILDEPTRRHLRKADLLSSQAASAKSAAAAERRAAATRLRKSGLTVRDIGTVLGVSHQRAQQLVNS